MRKTPNHGQRWPLLAAAVGAALVVGFAAARLTAPGAAAVSVAAADKGKTPADAKGDGNEVKIPAEYLSAVNIVVEPVTAGGAGSEILAPATVVAAPGNEASVSARVAGSIRQIRRRIGDTVQAGEALAVIDSPEAAAMAADRRAANAKADLARKAWQRESDLFKQGVSPRQDMESAQAALAVAAAEAQRATAVANASHLADEGGAISVVSPIAGRITAQQAALGAFVETGAPLFRVAATNGMQVEVAVTAADSLRLAAGDEATVLAAGGPVGATVHSITPTVDPASKSATVVLALSGESKALVIGEGVQARLHTRGGAAGMSVPEDAVQVLDGHDVLFLRTAEGFRPQPVLVGARSGGVAQIVSGVHAGDRVATRNAFLVKAEMNKGAEEEE